MNRRPRVETPVWLACRQASFGRERSHLCAQLMEIAELERLVALLKTTNISELTLRESGARVTIRKTPETVYAPVVQYAPGELSPEDEELYEATEHDEDSGLVEITAPLVGFFRHVKPIVGLGATVKQGQTVGIIEAMKLITEIPSPVAGTIEDVYVEDGLPVEYGHLLFLVKPS